MIDAKSYEDAMLWEDRHSYSLPKSEMERRWSGLRKRMSEKGIDYLLCQSQNRYVGGYFRYFTDMPGANYHITAVFPLDGDMSIITHGAPATRPPAPDDRGVRERIVTPAFPNTWWEDAWDANKAVEVMNRNKPRKVGLVGLGNMSAALSENIRKGLPGVDIVNATDLVDELRMVKSEEELKLHREAAHMHEMSYEFAKNAIRPGRTAYEVIQEIRYEQLKVGSEEQQIAITYGPFGGPKYHQMSWGNTHARRPFKRGDVVDMLLMESSVAGGYWYDLRRMLSIGPVPREMQEAYDIVKEARRIMAENLKVGQKVGVALDASDAYMKSKGLPPEPRMGGHGQGLDLAERPVIRYDEPAILQPSMVIIPHPTAFTKKIEAVIGDNYVMTNAGAVPLYKSLFDDDEIAVL
jgi:Xaa-Pro aminopeptidase